MQKQGFQMELSETESALKEIQSSEGDVYKIAGQFLIKISPARLCTISHYITS